MNCCLTVVCGVYLQYSPCKTTVHVEVVLYNHQIIPLDSLYLSCYLMSSSGVISVLVSGTHPKRVRLSLYWIHTGALIYFGVGKV